MFSFSRRRHFDSVSVYWYGVPLFLVIAALLAALVIPGEPRPAADTASPPADVTQPEPSTPSFIGA